MKNLNAKDVFWIKYNLKEPELSEHFRENTIRNGKITNEYDVYKVAR